MRQRYVGDIDPADFPTLDPPVTLGRGDIIDHPTLLPGFEPAEKAADKRVVHETTDGDGTQTHHDHTGPPEEDPDQQDGPEQPNPGADGAAGDAVQQPAGSRKTSTSKGGGSR